LDKPPEAGALGGRKERNMRALKLCVAVGLAVAVTGTAWGVTVPAVQNGYVFFEMTDHNNGAIYTADVDGTYTRTEAGGTWSGPFGGTLSATTVPDADPNEDTWGVFAIKILKLGDPIYNLNGDVIGMDDGSSGPSDVYYQWVDYVSDTGLVGMFYKGWDAEVVIEDGQTASVRVEGGEFDLWAVNANLLKRYTGDTPPTTTHEGPQFEEDRRDTTTTYGDWVDSGDGTKIHLLHATSEYWRFETDIVGQGYLEGGTVAYWDIDPDETGPVWNPYWGGTELFTDPDGQTADLWIDLEIVQDNRGWVGKSNDDGGALVVPEPATMLALFAGVSGLAGYISKRRRA